MTVLLAGTSGTGKSTLAGLLAARLGITTVVSTDSVRNMLRSFAGPGEDPLLWASTYQARPPGLLPAALLRSQPCVFAVAGPHRLAGFARRHACAFELYRLPWRQRDRSCQAWQSVLRALLVPHAEGRAVCRRAST